MMDQHWCTRAGMELIGSAIGVACLTGLRIVVAAWHHVEEANHATQHLSECIAVGKAQTVDDWLRQAYLRGCRMRRSIDYQTC